jgi:hypothetical protein
MITTTLERIRAHRPCEEGWRKLLEGLGKTGANDEPLPFARIVEINGIDDALWCCRVEPQYAREWRLFAVWCARQVQHLMKDPRSIAALDVAERYARGEATRKELDAAQTNARAASTRSDAEWYATGGACAAARDAADAVYAANDAAAAAVLYAAATAGADAADAVYAAAGAAQTEEFLRVVNETEGRAVASISEYEGVLR